MDAPQIGRHLAEAGAAGLLGGLRVHEFLGDAKALHRRVVFQELELRRDREILFLLFHRGDPGIKNRPADFAGGLSVRCVCLHGHNVL